MTGDNNGYVSMFCLISQLSHCRAGPVSNNTVLRSYLQDFLSIPGFRDVLLPARMSAWDSISRRMKKKRDTPRLNSQTRVCRVKGCFAGINGKFTAALFFGKALCLGKRFSGGMERDIQECDVSGVGRFFFSREILVM